MKTVFAFFPLLTVYQRERFGRLRYGVLDRLNRVEIFPNTDWLSGFINGEGSFSIRANGECCFYIEHTDKVVLDLIRKDLT